MKKHRPLENVATQDFFQALPDKASCNSTLGACIGYFNALPIGVDPDNLRVQQLVGWCRHFFPLHDREGFKGGLEDAMEGLP